MALAKLKALLRAAAARTIPDLWQAIADALRRFTPHECAIISRRRIRCNVIRNCSRFCMPFRCGGWNTRRFGNNQNSSRLTMGMESSSLTTITGRPFSLFKDAISPSMKSQSNLAGELRQLVSDVDDLVQLGRDLMVRFEQNRCFGINLPQVLGEAKEIEIGEKQRWRGKAVCCLRPTRAALKIFLSAVRRWTVPTRAGGSGVCGIASALPRRALLSDTASH
jgi:hypothetical protein